MATPDISKLLRIPGRLSHTPTSLASAYPHGGTAIGTVGSVDFRLNAAPFEVTAQEWSGAVIDLIETTPRPVFDFTLREVLDIAALAAMFPCYVVGAQGGPILKFNVAGAVRGGFKIGASLSFVVVFTPDSPDDHPFLILRRAVPAIQESAVLAFRGSQEVGIPLRFYATPNSTKDVFDFGLRRDLTL